MGVDNFAEPSKFIVEFDSTETGTEAAGAIVVVNIDLNQADWVPVLLTCGGASWKFPNCFSSN